MTIKEILKTTSVYLNRMDILEALESEVTTEEDIEKETDVMRRLANEVLNELATEYLPMVKCEAFTTEEGKVYYSHFAHNPIRIRKIIDDKLRPLSFNTAQNKRYILPRKRIVLLRFLRKILPPADMEKSMTGAFQKH